MDKSVAVRLFAVVADCLNGAGILRFFAEGGFVGGGGLFCDKRAACVAYFEKAFGCRCAKSASDALGVDIEFAGYIKFVFFVFVCHNTDKSTKTGAGVKQFCSKFGQIRAQIWGGWRVGWTGIFRRSCRSANEAGKGWARIAAMCVFCGGEVFCCRRSGNSSAGFIWRRAGQGAILEQRIRHACYIPNPSFFASASARSRTAFSARSISAFRAAMFSFAIFERSASVYKNAPSKLPHVGSIL